MKVSEVSLLVITLTSFSAAAENQIACENTGPVNACFIGQLEGCFINQTEINSNDVSITPGAYDSVKGLYLLSNMNAKYLPVKIHITFPNLVAISARDCAIKSIAKVNFEGLSELKTLTLSNNQIESIGSDSFDDLLMVRRILLDNNRIQKLVADPFQGLQNLKHLNLKNNTCIEIAFDGCNGFDISQQFSKSEGQECDFPTPEPVDVCKDKVQQLEDEIQRLKDERNKAVNDKNDGLLTISRLQVEAEKYKKLHSESQAEAIKYENLYNEANRQLLEQSAVKPE